jgi:hypothetical protein
MARAARRAHPVGVGPVTSAATCSFRPATRTWKNSSRLDWKMARNLARSSSGARVLGQGEHPLVELQPGQLAVEVADLSSGGGVVARGCRRVCWSSGGAVGAGVPGTSTGLEGCGQVVPSRRCREHPAARWPIVLRRGVEGAGVGSGSPRSARSGRQVGDGRGAPRRRGPVRPSRRHLPSSSGSRRPRPGPTRGGRWGADGSLGRLVPGGRGVGDGRGRGCPRVRSGLT